MITRTYYFPANLFGRDLINKIIARVGCSIGDVHKVCDLIAVSMTMPRREVETVERVLQTYDLI